MLLDQARWSWPRIGRSPSLASGDHVLDVPVEGADPLAGDYTDEMQRAFVVSSGMGLRESTFYASLSAELPVRVPRCYFAASEDSGEQYIMLLENFGISDMIKAAYFRRKIACQKVLDVSSRRARLVLPLLIFPVRVEPLINDLVNAVVCNGGRYGKRGDCRHPTKAERESVSS